MTSAAERQNVVVEALTWLNTPYVHGARVKGAGCDCATLLLMVWRECGLIPDEEVGIFSPDWFANTSEDTYMRRVLRHAYKVAEAVSYATLDASPGNIVLTRSTGSKVYNHGGIVIRWPQIIHAVEPRVELTDATKHELWCFVEVSVFDPWRNRETA